MPASDPSDSVAEKIVAFIQAQLPDAHDVFVENLQRVAGGMSTENWLFEARWEMDGRSVREPLVLRCAAHNEIVEATRQHEFLLLEALSAEGLPVPRAFWMDVEGRWFGRQAMLLEKRRGRTERSMLQERNALGLDLAARQQVAQQIADTLADIHKIDVERIPHLRAESNSVSPAERELEVQDGALRRDGREPEAELLLARRWLRAHLPPRPSREVVVHGDYRPANVLVENGQLTTVLDWELAHRGDPAEDLGWYLAQVYRHEHFIAGSWRPADFLARYEQRSGQRIDASALRFWSIFATYKLAIIAVHSTRALVEGDHARLGPPAHRLIESLMRAISSKEDA